MSAPLTFSIVLNNFNYAAFLGAAIDSALAQTWPQVQVVVVDDGSTDTSREVIASYTDRVVPVLKTNGGQGSCFTAGLAAATGEIILFLDADDLLDACACARVAAAWQPDFAKVHFPLRCVGEKGESLDRQIPARRLDEGEIWEKLVRVGYQVCSPTSGNAWSAAVLREVLPMPGDYRQGADEYLNCTVPFFGRVGAIHEPLGSYRIHGRSYFSSATSDPARFGQLLERRITRKLKRNEVMTTAARRRGVELGAEFPLRDFSDLRNRLLSLRTRRAAHPIPGDRLGFLLTAGIRALFRDAYQRPVNKLKHLASFLALGLCPAPLVQPLATRFLRI